MNTDSERAKKWQKDNPEKVAISKARKKAKKLLLQEEAIKAHKRSNYKTQIAAIKAFCADCSHGTKHGGSRSFPNAPVVCKRIICPLFAYRNGDPRRIVMGKQKDAAKMRRAIK